jgi:hypothetical protein
MRHIPLRATIVVLTLWGAFGTATATPVLISYAAIVTSNDGEATDGIFLPGTVVRVQAQVDSESLLRVGVFLPASGSAETEGAVDTSLMIETAGSATSIACCGVAARVYSFRGQGPAFEADGDPPSDDIWTWEQANLYLPPVPDLDSLLALTLDDVNELITAFGSAPLLTFIHRPNPNSAVIERARTSVLYEFSISRGSVPEPPLLPLLGLAAGAVLMRRRLA